MNDDVKADYEQLIDLLESAADGCVELDRDIALTLGITQRQFSSSVDDALILIAEPYTGIDLQWRDDGLWYASISVEQETYSANSATAPLVICIATLKARLHGAQS